MTDLPVRVVAGIKEPPVFGINKYVVPVAENPHYIKYLAPTKSKNISVFEQEANVQKYKPGPIYVSHDNWNNLTVDGPKGRFGKYKKITFTEEVFAKMKGAGPHTFETYLPRQNPKCCLKS